MISICMAALGYFFERGWLYSYALDISPFVLAFFGHREKDNNYSSKTC